MKKVAIDDVRKELNPMGVHSVRRPVSDALGTEHFAMNYFELETGESFSGGMHTHHDQEEVFYVQEGTAVFETPDEDVVVDEGELVRFAPGDFQMGYNDPEHGEETVVGFALGAPSSKHDWEEIESIVYCQDCEEETGHGLELIEGPAFEMTCLECGNTFSMGSS
ncbi:MAG: cupin domain-containing protein [Halobacteriales archaeon]|nr:cupin domain-containing protein [Halobacteriales archaeon]